MTLAIFFLREGFSIFEKNDFEIFENFKNSSKFSFLEDVFEDLDDLDCQKSVPNSKKFIFGGRVRESGRFWARKNSKNCPKFSNFHFWRTCSKILQKTGKLDSGSRV